MKWLRWSLPFLALALLAVPPAAAAVAQSASIVDARFHSLLPRNAEWALVVEDLETGRELVVAGTSPSKPLAPASLAKLFTAGAVLDLAEGDRQPRLTTKLFFDGAIADGTLEGNLYLTGNGNAFLSMENLRSLGRSAVAGGIRRVSGSIVADDTFFDVQGLERSHCGAGYAPPGALGMDLHTVAVTVSPTEPGKPPRVTVEPSNDAVRCAVEARTAPAPKGSLAVVQVDDVSYRVTGNVNRDAAPSRWRFPVKTPARYAAEAFKTSLGGTKGSALEM